MYLMAMKNMNDSIKAWFGIGYEKLILAYSIR